MLANDRVGARLLTSSPLRVIHVRLLLQFNRSQSPIANIKVIHHFVSYHMPENSTHHNYYVGPSNSHNNIERIGDHGRGFLGQIGGEPANMTNQNNSHEGMLQTSHIMLCKDVCSCVFPLDTHKLSHHALLLEERLQQLERNAVTFQKDCNEAREEHYGDNNKYNFEAGELYRVWHPTNTEVHLCTFLVVFTKGTTMTCLKVVQCDPDQADYKFQHTHGKFKLFHDQPGNRRSTRLKPTAQQDEEDSDEYLVHLRKEQIMKDNCWVDMATPWNINWQKEYLFVYCGCLDNKSFLRARARHLLLYTAQASSSSG